MTQQNLITSRSRLISAGNFHTLAVKADGTVLSTGKIDTANAMWQIENYFE